MTTRRLVELALAFKQYGTILHTKYNRNNSNDNKMTNVTFQEEKKIVVVGTGDKGHGLAKSYVLHSKKDSHYKFVLTEPMPSKIIDPFNSDFITIEHFPECLANADIVLLCIPGYASSSSQTTSL